MNFKHGNSAPSIFWLTTSPNDVQSNAACLTLAHTKEAICTRLLSVPQNISIFFTESNIEFIIYECLNLM